MKLFLITLLIAAVLLRIPLIGKYLKIINTLIHEIGHALVAKLTGGEVDKIQLFANTEGVAWTRNKSWLGGFLTSIAGYPFASFMSYLFLFFLTQEKIGKTIFFNGIELNLFFQGYQIIFLIIIFLLFVSLLFWVRNFYGFLWILSFIIIVILFLWWNNAIFNEIIVNAIVAVIFLESLTSSITLLKLSFKTPNNCGDASNLAASTIIFPSQFWGIFFALQAFLFSILGFTFFL